MAERKQKTVFILIARGYLTRNILRSGVLKHLKMSNQRIVVFFCDVCRKKNLPQNLRDEFEDNNVILELVAPPDKRGVYRVFWKLSSLLTYSPINRKMRAAVAGRNYLPLLFEKLFFIPLSRMEWLKSIARWIERNIFTNNPYRVYFDKYRPDVVFSTSLIASFDVWFLKEARRRGVETVGMPKGWDNVKTIFYRAVPDRVIVQNSGMKHAVTAHQYIPEKKIFVTGFPQFDWHRSKQLLWSREEYARRAGLDPARKFIFLGTTGQIVPDDKNVAGILSQIVSENQLVAPCDLLIRPHFLEVKRKQFEYLQEYPHVRLDDNFTLSDFFRDNCDPDVVEVQRLVNTIHHADIVVTLCSTLSLDALCHDKPLINIAFNAIYDSTGRDITPIIYTLDHYQPLLETRSVDLVYSPQELIEHLNTYLRNPHHKSEERKRALERMCYKVDGRAGERVARVILNTEVQEP